LKQSPEYNEALQDIVDKLNVEGEVSSRITAMSPAGIPMNSSIQQGVRASDAAADTTTCQVRLKKEKGVMGG
jgi:hypothetical protein